MIYSDVYDVNERSRDRERAQERAIANVIEWDRDWLAQHCRGDGSQRHPLLAAPRQYVREQSVAMAGEIVHGRGVVTRARFSWRPRNR